MLSAFPALPGVPAFAQVHPLTDPATLPGPIDDLTGTEYGRALVWLDGPIDFEATAASGDWFNPVYKPLTEVLLTNLGEYDTNSQRVADNGGLLTGRYLETDLLELDSLISPVNDFTAPDNDFRVNPFGNGTTPKREALLWSAQAHQYYYNNDYRVRFLNDAFIDSLNLPADLANNIKNLHYRPDAPIENPPTHKPVVRIVERTFTKPFQVVFFPDENVMQPFQRTRSSAIAHGFQNSPGSTFADLAPLAYGLAPEVTVGDYAGLVAFQVIGSNFGFTGELGCGDTSGAQNDISCTFNDALNQWVGYRYSGNIETHRLADYFNRWWEAQMGIDDPQRWGVPIAQGVVSTSDAHIPWDRGRNIRNVMMIDEANGTKDGVYPFRSPPNFDFDGGPVGGELAALFVDAVFYDIAHEAGLGVHKADQLIWKMISVIDEPIAGPEAIEVTPRIFGGWIQEAARALWPDPNNPGLSLYENDINDVLTSRGIAVNGVGNFRDNLPPAIGDFGEGTLETSSANGFGSSHPEFQPSAGSYGQVSWFPNGYIHPDASAEYVAYEFYKHSKYGPADKLILTDGTFSLVPFEIDGVPQGYDIPVYNEDGSFFLELTDRDLGNLVLLAPGTTIQWVRWRERGPNEAEAFYAEDVRPFGFRVIDADSNGFSFTVEELSHTGDALARAFEYSGELVGTKTFRTSIVDPSLALLGDADYFWTVTDYLGNEQTGVGLEFVFTLGLDQPFSIEIVRDRDGVIDTLSLRERVNDFARSGGSAFVFDAFTPTLLLPGDLDGDGFVGISDLNLVLGNWNQSVTPGSDSDGDPSGDGFVGIADLNVVLGNWNAGTPPGAPPAANANIPEPGALGLLVLGGFSLTRRGRPAC